MAGRVSLLNSGTSRPGNCGFAANLDPLILKKIILILKTKDLENIDPENKRLSEIDPENKGFSANFPKIEGRSRGRVRYENALLSALRTSLTVGAELTSYLFSTLSKLHHRCSLSSSTARFSPIRKKLEQESQSLGQVKRTARCGPSSEICFYFYFTEWRKFASSLAGFFRGVE